MSKRQNLLAVWQQIPVANRTVNVNDKTGFSLTAGSYAVTGTVQRGTILLDNATSNTATISAVTTTKTLCTHAGATTQADETDATWPEATWTLVTLTNTTTVTLSRNTNIATMDTTGGYEVVPYV